MSVKKDKVKKEKDLGVKKEDGSLVKADEHLGDLAVDKTKKISVTSDKSENEKKHSSKKGSFALVWSFIREKFSIDPLTKKRIMRFKQIRRAYVSFVVMIATLVIALFAELLINKRPLIMWADGALYFPVYGRMNYNKDFNFADNDHSEINYREFKKELREKKRGWMLLPLIPFDAFEIDSAEAPLSLSFSGTPCLGVATDQESEEPYADRLIYRWFDTNESDAVKQGESEKYVWIKYCSTDKKDANTKLSDSPDSSKQYIGFAWDKTTRTRSTNHDDYTWFKIGSQNNSFKQPNGKYTWVRYASNNKGHIMHPLPPSFKTGHVLGTDRIGRDVLARLVYGYRIAILFSLLYVFITFFIGIVIGVLMGYYGGTFDTVLQRFIEIWEQIPFLYMVMILSAIFAPSFAIFLAIFVLFGWTGKTWTARAMTYRERERDYILAARSMGASTWRIVSVHVIPNIIVIILTSLPFAISGGISSLTSLDFLGYGLRPPTPSWGELLNVGIATFKNAPWILSSITVAMVCILVMITFIGEGLRDAFDPRRFTVYR